MDVPQALKFIKQRKDDYACMNSMTPLWQFWRPSAWADALGMYTRAKRWLTLCYPLVAVTWVLGGLRVLQVTIRDQHLTEAFWTGARLDLWVLALYLILAVPVSTFWAIRYHALDGMNLIWNIDDRKKMVEVLGQTLEAGSVLERCIQGYQAQSQTMDSFDTKRPLVQSDRVGRQDRPIISRFMLLGMQRLTEFQMHKRQRQTTNDEAIAAWDLHSRIIRNLTARLSISARLLFGITLTDPWELLKAFEQFDQSRRVDARSSRYVSRKFSTLEEACVYVKIKSTQWAARRPQSPVTQLWRPSAWADALHAHGFVWPNPVTPLLCVSAWFAHNAQPFVPSMYLKILDLCGALAAGYRAAWLTISILLVVFILIGHWIVYVRLSLEADNLRLYKAHAGLTISGLANLFADILELEDAKRLLQACAQDQLGGVSQPAVSCKAGNLLVQRHLGRYGHSNKLMGSSKLQHLLTIKVCNEMIATLRGRLAAICHRVTGLWLSEIPQARDAIHQKIALLRETQEPLWIECMLGWLGWCYARAEWCYERIECMLEWCQDRFQDCYYRYF